MAVLFGVFSLGALFDTDRQSFSPESQEYCFLARTALAYNAQVTPLSITGYVSSKRTLHQLVLISMSI